MSKITQGVKLLGAILAYPFFKLAGPKKPILLVGGHEGKLFIDNGKAMYLYLLDHQTDYQVYWVINPDSPDLTHVPGPYLIRGSIKSYLYYMKASGVFFSHSASDLAPILHRFNWLPQPVKTNLEHGVTGFKKAKANHASTTEPEPDHYGPEADIFLSCAPFETQIKNDFWHIPSDQIVETGYARYDQLILPKQLRQEIIYMPTWREWLVGLTPEELKQTDFYHMIESMVQSKELAACLEKHQTPMKIYIHFYFHQYIEAFQLTSKWIEFLPIETEIQDYLIHSQLMITDYSSVAWDFYYLEKPVIFYQPDLAKYNELRGAYLDFETDLFGPQVKDLRELIKQIDTCLTHPTLDSKYLEKLPTYFTYQDQHNAKRIYEAFLAYQNKH